MRAAMLQNDGGDSFIPWKSDFSFPLYKADSFATSKFGKTALHVVTTSTDPRVEILESQLDWTLDLYCPCWCIRIASRVGGDRIASSGLEGDGDPT